MLFSKRTRSPLATPADTLSLPWYTGGLVAFQAVAAMAISHQKPNKTLSFMQANLHLFALLRGIKAKKKNVQYSTLQYYKTGSVVMHPASVCWDKTVWVNNKNKCFSMCLALRCRYTNLSWPVGTWQRGPLWNWMWHKRAATKPWCVKSKKNQPLYNKPYVVLQAS